MQTSFTSDLDSVLNLNPIKFSIGSKESDVVSSESIQPWKVLVGNQLYYLYNAEPTYFASDRRTCMIVKLADRLGEECRRNHKRCDKNFPSCSRCLMRGLGCVYKPKKGSKALK